MAENLQLNFSQSFSSKIWKYLMDTSGRYLLLELRDEKTQKLQFKRIDLQTKQVKTVNVPVTDWWVTIMDLRQTMAIFQEYKSEENPEIAAYFAWDIEQEQELWRKTSYDLPEPDTNILNPTFYPAANQYFETFKKFVQDQLSVQLANTGVEYAEWGKSIILSYYTQHPKLANYLLVMNAAKQVMLNECIDADIKGIGRDTFTIVHNKLIFVRNKTELVIYE